MQGLESHRPPDLLASVSTLENGDNHGAGLFDLL